MYIYQNNTELSTYTNFEQVLKSQAKLNNNIEKNREAKG